MAHKNYVIMGVINNNSRVPLVSMFFKSKIALKVKNENDSALENLLTLMWPQYMNTQKLCN